MKLYVLGGPDLMQGRVIAASGRKLTIETLSWIDGRYCRTVEVDLADQPDAQWKFYTNESEWDQACERIVQGRRYDPGQEA